MQRLLRFLASDGFGLTLLLLITLILMIAALLKPETAWQYIYISPFFFLLWVFLSISLLCALFFRFRFRFKSLGSILTHACVVLILIGGAVSAFFGERGFIELEEGQSSDLFYDDADRTHALPFEIALKDFSIDYYPGQPYIKEFRSTVELREGNQLLRTGKIEVNGPLKEKGYLLYQSGYDEENPRKTLLEVVRDPGVPIVYTGFVLLILGLSFVFFVKPNLRNHAG
ncbi:MAG: cytochrome c biogenesis protein ResB [Candidatus Omnitrophica bacterium]|nr:cytochrome c biogenesis protein ResB [Candidatus Omnitrophota bacterium]